MKGLLLMCVSSLALYAQTLEVSSKSASPGKRATVVVSIDLPKGSDILGLQWETTFSQHLSIEGSGPEVSNAAKAAGKFLQCAGRAAQELHSYSCILIGGQKQIESGPIAVLNFHISPKAPSGATPVRVGHAEAVTKDLRKISLPYAEGIVTVKR
jgi:hypothetical protein